MLTFIQGVEDSIAKSYFHSGIWICCFWILICQILAWNNKKNGCLIDNGYLRLGRVMRRIADGLIIPALFILVGWGIVFASYALDTGIPSCAKQQPDYCDPSYSLRAQDLCTEDCNNIRIGGENWVETLPTLGNAFGYLTVSFNYFVLLVFTIIGLYFVSYFMYIHIFKPSGKVILRYMKRIPIRL